MINNNMKFVECCNKMVTLCLICHCCTQMQFFKDVFSVHVNGHVYALLWIVRKQEKLSWPFVCGITLVHSDGFRKV